MDASQIQVRDEKNRSNTSPERNTQPRNTDMDVDQLRRRQDVSNRTLQTSAGQDDCPALVQSRNTFPNIPNEVSIYSAEQVSEFHTLLANNTIIVDVGCGHGDYLIEHTAKNPDKFYVGIEISRKRVYKTTHRLQKRGIQNYRVVDSDGESAFRLLFPDASADEILINFPDPWLRLKQWKNRILKPSLLSEIVRVLKVGAKLQFITDVAEYAEYAAGIIDGFPGLRNHYAHLIEKNLFESYPTLFYRKMSVLRDINYICFVKAE